jgi:hypothetical protein
MKLESEEITDCALNDPEKLYKTPEFVLSDERLTQEQKEKILHCWEQDELALIRAEEENMPSKTDEPLPVELLEKIKVAEKTLKNGAEEKIKVPAGRPTKRKRKVREAVGVFHDPEMLQAAIDDLQRHGFMRHEISVLAGESAIRDKLGHLYKHVQEAEDDPSAPRVMFISSEEMAVAKGAAVSIPLYIAAATAAGMVVASGGLLLDAIIFAAGAGAVGAGIGSMLATFIAKQRAEYLQEQLERGGLLLWVHLRSPRLENLAEKILLEHSAQDVHVHDIPVYNRKGKLFHESHR